MATRYINTDLDLVSATPCEALTAYLKALEWCDLYVGPGDQEGVWWGRWEVVWEEKPTLTSTITAFLSGLEALPAAARAEWESCSERYLDMGYDCGAEPWGFQQSLDPNLLSRIAALGISLRWTLYPEQTEPTER